MMKTKILKLFISTAVILSCIPAAVLSAAAAGPDSVLADEDLNKSTEMNQKPAASDEGSDLNKAGQPAAMPADPIAHGKAGVKWAVDENGILYLEAGELEKTDFDELFDIQSIRAVRVVPTETCEKLILPEDSESLFWKFTNLTEIDSAGFDTSQVLNMSGLFGYCSSLETLDLSSFDTSRAENLSGLFYECRSLKSLDVSGFDT
ncbi:MAG: BspA family leucine-rich repeat surface protein, partial [Erysipelotrichaceae bacterium]|nr:BspA family leucine-rich repeat surface protein [Erysipelotrichaceae bacterium]